MTFADPTTASPPATDPRIRVVKGDSGRIPESRGNSFVDYFESARIWTTRNPLLAIGIALGLGVAIGTIARRGTGVIASAAPPLTDVETIREVGSTLANKAQSLSSNVLGEIGAVLSRDTNATVANDSGSFADTIVATIARVASDTVRDWLKSR